MGAQLPEIDFQLLASRAKLSDMGLREWLSGKRDSTIAGINKLDSFRDGFRAAAQLHDSATSNTNSEAHCDGTKCGALTLLIRIAYGQRASDPIISE